VIVPVFNVRPYLRDALDSVLGQTHGKLEILVVDDGSTDGSGPICDEYRKDPRVRVVHQGNRGLSAARNAGLDLMTGEFVAFLDSDDVFCPDMIRSLLAAMQRDHADVAVTGFAKCADPKRGCARGKSRTYDGKSLTAREALVALVEGTLNKGVWNKVYARELWDGIRFPEGHVYEDVSTTFRVLARAERVLTVPGMQMTRRIRRESIMHTHSAKNLRDRMEAYGRLERFVEENTHSLFDGNQLRKLRAKALRIGIAAWCRLPREERENAGDIRKTMLQKRQALPSGDLDVRSRFACACLRCCPCLLPWLHSAHKRLKKTSQEVVQ
jgi:glycosyltransferase involved in cell wall biosynthesis